MGCKIYPARCVAGDARYIRRQGHAPVRKQDQIRVVDSATHCDERAIDVDRPKLIYENGDADVRRHACEDMVEHRRLASAEKSGYD
jgi:hypothetical protein